MFEQTSQWTVDQIEAQAPVYDVAGERVGRVEEYVRPGDYLLIEKGWFSIQDMYVPAQDIARADDQGVYLRITKEQLRDARYASPPTVDAGTGTPAAAVAGTLDGADRSAPRRAVERPVGASYATAPVEIGEPFQERDIEVPLVGETVVVGKRVRGVEEVRIHKEVVLDTEQVRETVRKERVRVEETGFDANAP